MGIVLTSATPEDLGELGLGIAADLVAPLPVAGIGPLLSTLRCLRLIRLYLSLPIPMASFIPG